MVLRRDRTYSLEFAKSRSKFYPDVIRAARTIPGFEESTDSRTKNRICLSAVALRDHLRAFRYITETARKWKGTAIYIDNVPLNEGELAALSRVIRCLADYDDAPIQEGFCTEDRPVGLTWGCRHLNAVQLNPTYWPRAKWWFQMVDEDASGSFVVQKDAIREAVNREVRWMQVDLCPAFDTGMIERSLAELPDILTSKEVEALEEKTGIRPRYPLQQSGGGYSIKISVDTSPEERKPLTDEDIWRAVRGESDSCDPGGPGDPGSK